MKTILFSILALLTFLQIYPIAQSDLSNLENQRAFFKALNNNHLEMVEDSINKGADINMINPKTNLKPINQLLSNLSEYIDKKWVWIFTVTASGMSALASILFIEYGKILSQIIDDSVKKGIYKIKILRFRHMHNIEGATHIKSELYKFGIMFAIGSLTLGVEAYIQKTRIKITIELIKLLLSKQQIQFDDISYKYIKEIMGKASTDIKLSLKPYINDVSMKL